ncbi:hypothetical protein [Burkholderia sp. Bp9131]|uniref:hypothetical protein n=1 Tax=Burkholderia sp. Bp9131 TaxID=2184571 RepID=UPI000F55F781|nr:hypothetical protein [Burkholderia sp. Bp9131]
MPTEIIQKSLSSNAVTPDIVAAKPKKARPLVGLPKTSERSFDVNDMKLCGENVLACAMLADIRFWTNRTHRPIARSIADWAARFNCSRKTVRTAIKYMRASGKVECTEAWFNGSWTPHYEYVATDGHLQADNGMAGAGKGMGAGHCGTTITDITPSETPSIKYTNPHAPASPTPCKDAPAPITGEKPTGKNEKSLIEQCNVEEKKNTHPYQHYFELEKHYDMEKLLKVLIDSGYLQSDRKLLSEKECRVLWPIHLQLTAPASDTEDDLESVLATFGKSEGWGVFCSCVIHHKPNVASWPDQPNLFFLKKHLNVLTNQKRYPPPHDEK